METSTLLLAVVFSAIGMGYMLYGKKQRNIIAFASGIGLCTYTYFITNVLAAILAGLVIMAIPIYFKD